MYRKVCDQFGKTTFNEIFVVFHIICNKQYICAYLSIIIHWFGSNSSEMWVTDLAIILCTVTGMMDD